VAIAVTTPTGNVGSQLVRRLLQAGERPVVLVRDPSRLDAGFLPHVDARQGDLADRAYVTRALAGVEGLYLVIPEVLMVDDPEADAEAIADVVIGAVESAGVARVVFQSSLGAQFRSGAGFISALGRVEERLDALADRTGIAVCHLRSGYLFSNLLMDVEGLRRGELRNTIPEDTAMPWVAPTDVAAVALGRLLSSSWTGHVVQSVSGPEDLTYPQVAAIVREATGWPVTYTCDADADVRAGLAAAGFSPAAVDSIAGMSEGIRHSYDAGRERSILTTTPTPLDGWVRQHLDRATT
jgi:uncharacterized protein YbjT (DUF2867 family)